MEQKNESKAYALYTYIDINTDKKCGATLNTFSAFYPNLYTKLKVLNHTISYAIQYYFDVEIKEPKPMKMLKNGQGLIEGFYFSVSECGRIIAVSVSKEPTGICIQVPFPIYDEQEYANHNFSKNELKEYQKRLYGKETYFYMLCQKRAYQKKYQLTYEDLKNIDSTQEHYTFYKCSVLENTVFFAITNQAELSKIDVKDILT